MKFSEFRVLLFCFAVTVTNLFANAAIYAANATWIVDADGDWTTDSNWTDPHPNGVDEIASLTNNIDTATRVVTLDAASTIGILNIGDPTSPFVGFTLGGSNMLTFDVSSGSAAINKITADSTAGDLISVPISLSDNLTINNAATSPDGAITISGTIGQSVSNRTLTKSGGGMLILSAANTYTGATTINGGGILRITDSSALGASTTGISVSSTSSRLELAGDVAISKPITIGGTDSSGIRLASVSGNNTSSGLINLSAGGGTYRIQSLGTASGDFFTISGNIFNNRSDFIRILRLGGDGNGTVSGVIGGTASGDWGEVVKEHAGTWTLSGANIYIGKTTVISGTLALAATGSITNSPTIQISNGATLDISAQAGGFTLGTTVAQTIKGDGAVTGNVSFVAGSGIAVDYNGSLIDSLAISGSLDITNAAVTFNNLGAALTGGNHVIATYGSLVGSAFASVTNLPSGYTLNYSYLGNQIALVSTAVPGDFDGDGDVDGADFVAWQTNFPKASGATLVEGDADGDGDVDGADFVVWQTNFPFMPGPGVSSVPEPSSWLLITIGLLSLKGSLRSRLMGAD